MEFPGTRSDLARNTRPATVAPPISPTVAILMRPSFFTTSLTLLCLALPATAQKVQVFGGNADRAATTQVLFGANVMAGMSITYGQPQWHDHYDGMLEKLKGKLLRLGKDWWTTFTTSADVEIGGVKLAAGAYLLGLSCDKDGKFALAVLEASKGLKAGAAPWPLDDAGAMNWKPDHLIPLTLHQGEAKESVEKLTITLKANADDLAKGSLTLAWGKHTLTASLAVLTAKQ